MIFQFNQITLDTAQYRLCVAGNPVSVEPQVFDLLVYLLENRNRLVTRDELLENLWKGKVVTDSALGARIKDARKAVGDNGKQQNIIKTIHGRGYQFVAKVETSSGVDKGIAPPPPDQPSIVVLPFENLSEAQDSDYFADGLTKDIIANLCCYRELFVIDSHSAFMFRDSNFGAENFARQVAVEYIVRGSIRRADERVRISVELVEATSGRMIWTEKLERTLDDVFDLEDEVSSKIASSLAGHIENVGISRAVRKPPESMTAYDYVLRARQYSDSYEQEEIATLRSLLGEAIRLDPRYAPAYSLLALSYTLEFESDWCSAHQEALEQAVSYARQAMELDDFNAYAHMIMGLALLYQSKFDLAEDQLDRAIECNPNDYDAYCVKSWVLACSGRASEVNSCGAKALQLNPLLPDQCLMAMILAHYSDGDYESALDILERIDYPSGESEALRAASLFQLGRESEARRAAAKAVELGGDFLQQRDWLLLWPFKHPRDREHFLEGLYKSGVLKDPEVVSAKPSIAVLRFSNLSDDSGQAYFAYGMTANICSRLSRIRSLQVKSGIEYDLGKTSLADISRELGVSYLLSGSVQREDDRVRVFVELTDGISGEITWSENFDRRGKDVIDIQDEIAIVITGTLWSNRGTILEAERDKLAKKPTSDFNAFDYLLKGIYYKEKFNAEELMLAHECFDKAIELDPDSAEAYGWSAWVHLLEILLGSTKDSAESLKKAYAAARKAIEKDAYSEIGHWALAEAYMTDQDTMRGLVEIEKALDINPNNPDLIVTKGSELCILGRFDEGIELINQGINFNKHHPEWYFWHMGIGCFAGHRWQDSIDAFIRMDNQNKDTLTYLVACYAQTGDLAEAENQLKELFVVDPDVRLEEIAETHSYLAPDTLNFLVDGIKLVLDKSKPSEKLRVVQS
jgi:TolB-like protein/Tfp pilus assembly protein PilF